jgi:hypothetical protein
MLRELARNGQLHSLTLFRTSEGSYQVSVTHDRKAWHVAVDVDPVEAIRKAVVPKLPAPDSEDIFG